MRANRSHGLFALLLAATLAGACGADGDQASRLPASPPGGVGSRDYKDPDGAFAVKVPGGWKVEREDKDGAYLTVIRHEQYRAANLSILTIPGASAKNAPADLQPHVLADSSRPFFQGWIGGLKEQARVEGTGDVYPTQFKNFRAMRLDVTYYRGDADDPRSGYAIFFYGDKTSYFISLTGSRSGFKELEEIISTLRIEP
jgi:hypothetical protein